MLTDQELQSLRNMGNEAQAAADEIVRLRAAGQKLVDAYRDRYRKPSTAGLRADAPLYREFAEFNGVLQGGA